MAIDNDEHSFGHNTPQYPEIINALNINNRLNGDSISNHLLIWIDILGYKEMMDQIIREDHFSERINLLNQLKDEVRSAFSFAVDQVNGKEGTDPGIRIFSDNILLYCKLYGNPTDLENIIRLFSVASSFQWFMINDLKMLVRGAATNGLFYADETFVFGPALIEAYELESKTSAYPRIIISDSLLKYLRSLVSSDSIFDGAFGELVWKDFDGLHSINGHFVMYGSEDFICKYKTSIETLKNKYLEKNERLKTKMNYLIHNFNLFCEEQQINQKIRLLED